MGPQNPLATVEVFQAVQGSAPKDIVLAHLAWIIDHQREEASELSQEPGRSKTCKKKCDQSRHLGGRRDKRQSCDPAEMDIRMLHSFRTDTGSALETSFKVKAL